MTQTALSSHIADVLTSSLKRELVPLCTERYGGPVSLHHLQAASEGPGTVRGELELSGLPPLTFRFWVCHVGGNVYDVRGAVENRSPRSFAYSLPDTAPSLLTDVPRLARELALFLLDSMERELGRRLLRERISEASRLTSPPGGEPAGTK